MLVFLRNNNYVVTLNIKTSRCTDHLVPDALHRGRHRVQDRHHALQRVRGGPRREDQHHPEGILGGALAPEGEDVMPEGSLVVTGLRDAEWLRSRPSS